MVVCNTMQSNRCRFTLTCCLRREPRLFSLCFWACLTVLMYCAQRPRASAYSLKNMISEYMLCKNSLMVQALFIQIQLPQGSKFQQFSRRHLMWTNHSPFHQPHFKWKSFQFQNQSPSFRTLCHQLILQVSSSPWSSLPHVYHQSTHFTQPYFCQVNYKFCLAPK